jgi:hypothetical protein
MKKKKKKKKNLVILEPRKGLEHKSLWKEECVQSLHCGKGQG